MEVEPKLLRAPAMWRPFAVLHCCVSQWASRFAKSLQHRLADGSAEERHHLRIAVQKARYPTEIFRRLHPAGRLKRYINRLTTRRDALGWLNDVAVADRVLA